MDVVYFVASPVSDVYRYYIFEGVVQKVIEEGESYYYEISPTKIMSNKSLIKNLNKSTWSCTKVTDKRPYCGLKKFSAPVMTENMFLSIAKTWNMNVPPILVYQYKTEARKGYTQTMEYLAKKLEIDLGYIHKQLKRE